MTDTTIPAEDAAGFFTEYAGVRIHESEDGEFIAYGHVSEAEMLAGIKASLAAIDPELTEGDVSVQHVWAVLKHSDGAADDDGWYFAWNSIMKDTEGAFPMTVVPSL